MMRLFTKSPKRGHKTPPSVSPSAVSAPISPAGSPAGRSPAARPRRRRRGRVSERGALTVICVLFLGSFSLRVVESGGSGFLFEIRSLAAAWAETDTAPTQASGTIVAPDEMLTTLIARSAELDQRARELEERELALRIAQREVAAGLAALTEAEASLLETLALADGAAAADLDRLTKMYETMKPKEAAALFAEMDPSFAAGFLGQMRPAPAADILADLDPQIAYRISLLLAGRNMNVPTQ